MISKPIQPPVTKVVPKVKRNVVPSSIFGPKAVKNEKIESNIVTKAQSDSKELSSSIDGKFIFVYKFDV